MLEPHDMSLADLAKVILNVKTRLEIRALAIKAITSRLSNLNGSSWAGTPLHERATITRALRAIERTPS